MKNNFLNNNFNLSKKKKCLDYIDKILTAKLAFCTKCAEILVYKRIEKCFYLDLESNKVYCSLCLTTKLKEQSLVKIKPCFGCSDPFADYGNNYDYCVDCAINNNRYILGRFKPNKCPECGDGSGWIKLGAELKIRTCKYCFKEKINDI